VDPDTSISFPKVLTIPSKLKLEPVSFVGVGVRTVSFLGIKVYSVAFYADLNNPNLKVWSCSTRFLHHLTYQKIPLHMAPEDKIRHIVQNTSCVIRIGEHSAMRHSLLIFSSADAVYVLYALARRIYADA